MSPQTSKTDPPPPSSARRVAHTPAGAGALLLFFLFFLAVTWKLFLTGDYSMLVAQDDACQSYPWLQYIAKTIRTGDFPFWDPTTAGGQSFLGELQTGAFYPPNWLLALVPPGPDGRVPDQAIEGLAFLHLLAAAGFMFWLARFLGLESFPSAVAGLTFAASGSVLFRAPGQLNLFFSTVWFPLALLCFLKALRRPRRGGVLLWANLSGLALALSCLAGHFQPPFFAALAMTAAGGYAFFRRLIPGTAPPAAIAARWTAPVALGAAFLFAGLYAAPQLSASLEYAGRAMRHAEPATLPADQGLSYAVAGGSFPLNPFALVSVVTPHLGGAETVLYFGIGALVLAVFGIREWRRSPLARAAAVLAALFLLLAMGKWSPLHGLAYLLIPGFDKGREAARLLLGFHAGAALLAGVGFQAWLSRSTPRRANNGRAETLTLAVSAAVLAGLAAAGPLFGAPALAAWTRGSPTFFVAGGLFAWAGLLFLRTRRLLAENGVKAALILLFVLEIFWFFSYSIHPKAAYDGQSNREPVRFYAADAVWRAIQGRPRPFRVEIDHPRYPRNIGQVNGIETVSGHSATLPDEVAAWRVIDPARRPLAFRLLNVGYLVTERNLDFPLAFTEGSTRVYRLPDPLPRAWVVGEAVRRPRPAKRGVDWPASTLDLRRTATVAADLSLSEGFRLLGESTYRTPAPPRVDALTYQRAGANAFRVAVNAAGPGLLVVSENFYPGWIAVVNGTPKPVLPVDGILQGVVIPAGRSSVVFSYRPTHFTAAALLAAAAGLTLFALGALAIFRKRNHP